MTSTPQTHAPRRSWGTPLFAFVVDAALVITFSALGRGEHGREATLIGLLETAWPFLAALALAWVVTLSFRRPLAPVRSGIPVWIITVTAGLLLRGLTGGGLALPFIIVTVAVLGAFLVGWRLIAALIWRLRPSR